MERAWLATTIFVEDIPLSFIELENNEYINFQSKTTNFIIQ